MQLYIGNQNYSSWSLRAWLIFAQFNIDVTIEKLKLGTDAFYQALHDKTPAAKVPTLVDGDTTVWDSLAILEYINESKLDGNAWPTGLSERAKARALSCEMHSGFFAIRQQLPMNCRASRQVELSDQVLTEIARVDSMWSEQMAIYPGQWLFGRWSIVDAMYAPLALRFATYQIPLSEAAKTYQHTVLNSPAIQQWFAQASIETDIVTEDEAGEPR
ncbi:glutathione S-transferase family protein [Celerinatantimonas yamalensis]|uniref:Glutathione S-transferase family protein n=1 Tax=Celerinatantimonas yamalensis TaxID=559956 RepID=A0ABW9G9R6_9GAMM